MSSLRAESRFGTTTSNGSTDKNISVIVRCRSLHPSHSNLPILATTSHPKRGHSIHLSHPPSSSSSSSPSPTKTYNFGTRPSNDPGRPPLGNVFGPEADQGLVYQDVAKPILNQVLQGYNCTLFAYGQTGTGKTYTMEGDLTENHGTFSSEAGIIPRTLYSLFAILESGGNVEFSVRVSFVELYNEELRDLNAVSWDVNASTNGGGLKIFDEKGGGTVIVGLEETLISSAEEGLKILKRGSERRMMASTKCNEQSSRSHSIFTLTIHIKETSNLTGEELIKVGKFNLVDLAGSENVGRSGAVQGRAREAGMINVSLLALGRVINKLVERNGHIPYRESKLTRLLQDSLGGKTRTTIIATISPINFEETSSTLDYALRAKTIQNRPELNQRMTKTALLGQLTNEIESLKRDLLATREKSGIYLSPDTYTTLQTSTTLLQAQLTLSQTQIDSLDSELSSVRSSYEQNLVLVKLREEECRRLVGVEEELRVERGRREEGERREREWRRRAGEAEEESRGVWEKLQREQTNSESNLRVVKLVEKDLKTGCEEVIINTEGFQVLQSQFLERVEEKVNDVLGVNFDVTTSISKFLSQKLESLKHEGRDILDHCEDINKVREEFVNVVESTKLQVCEFVKSQEVDSGIVRKEMREGIERELKGLKEARIDGVEQLLEPLREIEKINRIDGVEEEGKLRNLIKVDTSALVSENAHLKSLVKSLQTSFDDLHSKSLSSNASLLSLISSALNTNTKDVQDSYKSISKSIEDGIESHLKVNVDRTEERREVLKGLEMGVERRRKLGARLSEVGESKGRSVKLDVEKSINSVTTRFGEFADKANEATSLTSNFVGDEMDRLGSTVATFRTDASTSHDVLVHELLTVVDGTQDSYIKVGKQVDELREGCSERTNTVINDVQTHQTSSTAFTSSTTKTLDNLSQTLCTQLASQIQPDLPTGSTPIKRPRPTSPIPNSDEEVPAEEEPEEVKIELVVEPEVVVQAPSLTVLGKSTKRVLGEIDANAVVGRRRGELGTAGVGKKRVGRGVVDKNGVGA